MTNILFMRALMTIFVSMGVMLITGCSHDDGSPTSPSNPPSGGEQPSNVSFSQHVKPIFSSAGCLGCHGGNSGLFVGTVSQLLQGGDHGPAIVPGSPETSTLVKKISPNPTFGSRMPLGGPYLSDANILIISTWIKEGAKDN